MSSVPEEPTARRHRTPRKKKEDKPPFFKKHPVLGKVGEAAAGVAVAAGLACAPAAAAHTTTPQTVQSPHVAVAADVVREPTRLAHVASPDTRAYTDLSVGGASPPESRIVDGGSVILNDQTPIYEMTRQEYSEQIGYMFGMAAQYEVQPDSQGKYVTDEFIIKRSTGVADRAPIGSVVIFGKNSRDGGVSSEPLEFLPENGNIKVYRFSVDNSIVRSEVVAVVTQGGVVFYYFDNPERSYVASGASYGPGRYGQSPKIGAEINEQNGVQYIALAVADPQNFDANNSPALGSDTAGITLDLNGNGSHAVIGAGLHVIRE